MSDVLDRQECSSVDRLGASDDGVFSENAIRVLEARYLKKNEAGECTETPTELFRRVASAVADAELLHNAGEEQRGEWENRFYELMVSQRFMPNSPTLMNAGREMGMLSACFVLPVPDSISEIFDSIKYTALIQKAGGGTGFAFDELRPTGDYISSSGGTTSGPISFWRAFSEATNAIQQGAFRRGANMGMMNIGHPDILKFLHAKDDLTQFTNYNISVKISDKWMDSFLSDRNSAHIVENPRTKKCYLMPKPLDIDGYDIRTLKPVETTEYDADKFYSKSDVWDIIINNAWKTGEPGVVFIDRINQANPTPHIGRMEATNPCGEQPLLPFEACNLGSINLTKFVTKPGTPQVNIDWDGLRTTIHEGTRFLDDVIDVNRYPLPQIDEICKRNRKIGLGIMGFADTLFLLNVGYNTPEGVAWGKRLMKFVDDESHNYCEQLANERGCFPNWKGSIWDTIHHRPMRNATCTTVAPTGTISILADCTGGVEPMYNLKFYRNVLRGQKQGETPMVESNSIFEGVARDRGLFSEELMDQLATEGTLAGIDGVPEDVRRVFVCAHDVSPEWHVKMQAAFQEHCDASISKTINFPESATVEEVEEIYLKSYELRCKGVTVYRNECRKHQPMALKESKDEAVPERQIPEPQDLHDIACGVRIRQITPFGNMHVQITVDPETEQEVEVFAQLGKGGDLATSDLEAICRMISLWLRSGGRLHHVIRQLKGIGSILQIPTKEGKIRSLGDGVARALEKYARAKSKFGLTNLLTGQYNLSDLHDDLAARFGQGNGNGNGHRGSNGVGGNSHTTSLGAERFGQNSIDIPTPEQEYRLVCPDCQSPLYHSEGCAKCQSCGFSQC
ncbi:MAG: adenosylcobalamin-dependent ribonucleoside-diphosphate reductase [Planctomycetes bacterium]|nr:adenosylcobalamin-dependent ribonucleoside-diphosphate reductase [Planctomycetota bacterium]